MLGDFLASHRDELLSRACLGVAQRRAHSPTELASTLGFPVLFDQIRIALERGASSQRVDHSDLTCSAGVRGHALFQEGLTVAEVVHDYGDVSRIIIGLAEEEHAVIPAADLSTLNLCLEDAVAGALTEYGRQRERTLAQEGTERAGVLAHEMRNYLNTAMLALSSLKSGAVGASGATSGILQRSLAGLHTLVERSVASVRMEVARDVHERILLREVVEEVMAGAALLAKVRGLRLVMKSTDEEAVVLADRQLLTAALTNLVQNAFKFTRPGTEVTLRVSRSASRVRVEVEDACGGLPVGRKEHLIRPFVQRGEDRTGLGLGLSICVEAMQTMGGELHVSDLPSVGCVFALDLPRQPTPKKKLLGLPLFARAVKLAANI